MVISSFANIPINLSLLCYSTVEKQNRNQEQPGSFVIRRAIHPMVSACGSPDQELFPLLGEERGASRETVAHEGTPEVAPVINSSGLPGFLFSQE